MIPRTQLPVSSPIAAASLLDAAVAGCVRSWHPYEVVRAELRRRFGGRQVVLTDSGTSALALALWLLVRRGGTIALPAYACIDLVAAARFADVQVRLYDLDPTTLSVDLASLEAAFVRGVDAVVVAHLYGYPADMPVITSLARRYGVTVIEDAAQGAGGTIAGSLLGSCGSVSVLSFGRGKGMTSGGGGALINHDAVHDDAFASIDVQLGPASRGWRNLLVATAQWVLGRPTLYAIPLAIPGLRLGEMVYHPATPAAALPVTAACILRGALGVDTRECGRRRAIARSLLDVIPPGSCLEPIVPTAGGESGFLRLAIRDVGNYSLDVRQGIVRGYPRTIGESPEARSLLRPGEINPAGAVELRRSLVTFPTHHHVTSSDVERTKGWLRSVTATQRPLRSSRTADGNVSTMRS